MGDSKEPAAASWAEAWIEEQRRKLAAGEAHERQSPNANARTEDPSTSDVAGQLWRTFERAFSSGPFRMPPPLGWAREHDQAYRDLAAAHAQYRKLEAALQARLAAMQTDALSLLERKVRERADAQQPLATMRELYDLWVECSEQVYAQLAHSEAHCELQANLANAAVELRACQQDILERTLKQFDLPTRSELNTVHRQIRELRERLASHGTTDAVKRTVAKARAPRASKTARAGRRRTK